jgi:hypothetical protein
MENLIPSYCRSMWKYAFALPIEVAKKYLFLFNAFFIIISANIICSYGYPVSYIRP